ncbi:MAG: homoserine kinase [bacterium]
MSDWIKVFSPATVANLGPGFDILALAVEKPGDIVWARQVEKPGVTIVDIIGDNNFLPRAAEKNTAGVAAIEVLKKINSSIGIELTIEKQMPISSGLGSSSASACAAAFAANILTGEKLSKDELVEISGIAEHTITTNYGENCVAAMLGSVVVTTNLKPLRGRVIGTLPDLWVIVVYPHMQLETKLARSILPEKVSLKDAVQNNLNTAKMITGVVQQDTSLFLSGFYDLVIERYRKMLIPGFDEVKRTAILTGATNATISGAGPSMLAFATEKPDAEAIGRAMQKAFLKEGQESTVYVSKINTKGTHVID